MDNRATEIANHNETRLGVLLERLRTVRNAWLRKLEELGEADLARTALHPRLQQRMQLVDWLYFIAEHDDHHLTQISQLIQPKHRSRAEPLTTTNPAEFVSIPCARDLFDI